MCNPLVLLNIPLASNPASDTVVKLSYSITTLPRFLQGMRPSTTWIQGASKNIYSCFTLYPLFRERSGREGKSFTLWDEIRQNVLYQTNWENKKQLYFTLYGRYCLIKNRSLHSTLAYRDTSGDFLPVFNRKVVSSTETVPFPGQFWSTEFKSHDKLCIAKCNLTTD